MYASGFLHIDYLVHQGLGAFLQTPVTLVDPNPSTPNPKP